MIFLQILLRGSERCSCECVCVCVNLREAGAVLLQEEVGELLKDWLTMQSHKLFPTDLGGWGGHREKCSELIWLGRKLCGSVAEEFSKAERPSS